jgi:hypothetical protein
MISFKDLPFDKPMALKDLNKTCGESNVQNWIRQGLIWEIKKGFFVK